MNGKLSAFITLKRSRTTLAQFDFYTGVLGLRLVKITVNFLIFEGPGAFQCY